VQQEDSDHHRIMSANVAGVFFVVDSMAEDTLHAIDSWRKLLSRSVQCNQVPWILLSHKADLQQELATSFAKHLNKFAICYANVDAVAYVVLLPTG
jgi:hypothetical protein